MTFYQFMSNDPSSAGTLIGLSFDAVVLIAMIVGELFYA